MDAKYKETDLNEALDRLEMPEDILKRLIRKFLKGDLPDLTIKAFQENDMETCKLHAHTLKGASGNLGLTGLSRLAAEIEKKIKNKEPLPAEMVNALSELWVELKTNFEI